MKIEILRNLGAGWPSLVEGQVCEVGKDVAGDVAHALVKSGWLAKELPEETKPEPAPAAVAAPEVKGVEPVKTKGEVAPGRISK